MKYLTVLLFVIGLTMAQRPTYAGNSQKGYPSLANRFKDSNEDKNSTNGDSSIIVNRLGVGDDQPQNIPTDARGDVNLVNRLNQWPRENRPFWLLNAQQIETHRHPEISRNNQLNNQENQEIKNQQKQQNNNEERQFLLVSQPTDGGSVRSRFGESLDTETKTIKPNSQRGSFAGSQF